MTRRSIRELSSRFLKAQSAARVGANARERLTNGAHELGSFEANDLNDGNGTGDLAPMFGRWRAATIDGGITPAIARLTDENVKECLRDLRVLANEIERVVIDDNRAAVPGEHLEAVTGENDPDRTSRVARVYRAFLERRAERHRRRAGPRVKPRNNSHGSRRPGVLRHVDAGGDDGANRSGARSVQHGFPPVLAIAAVSRGLAVRVGTARGDPNSTERG